LAGIIAFHVIILFVAVAIASPLVPSGRVANALAYLHKSIGITTPPLQQVRTVALVWIGCLVVIVDGCLFLLLAVTRLSHPG
jgi:hypothetical protein